MKTDIHTETERGDIITLLEDHVETWNGRTFTVPAGFESDGVSTPRFLWSSISPKIHPATLRGGIDHDFVYREQPSGWTQKDADQMFYDIIREDGLSRVRAALAYAGLRLFGKKAWNENRRLKNHD